MRDSWDHYSYLANFEESNDAGCLFLSGYQFYNDNDKVVYYSCNIVLISMSGEVNDPNQRVHFVSCRGFLSRRGGSEINTGPAFIVAVCPAMEEEVAP